MKLTGNNSNMFEGENVLISKGLKFNHIKLIAALKDTGQLSAAARQMNIRQPAASRLISELEKIVGKKIYSGHPRGILLTDTGNQLAKGAKKFLIGLNELEREVSETANGLVGKVNIGAITGASLDIILPFLKIAREKFPKIEITITIDTSKRLANDLLNGKLDFYLGRIAELSNPNLYRSKVIGVEPMVLIAKYDHPILLEKSINIEQCLRYDWVLQARGEHMRHQLEKYFSENKLEMPKGIISTSSILMVLAIVSNSNSVALISQSVAKFYNQDLTQDNLKNSSLSVIQIPLKDKFFSNDYSLVCSADKNHSPATINLLNLIENQCGV